MSTLTSHDWVQYSYEQRIRSLEFVYTVHCTLVFVSEWTCVRDGCRARRGASRWAHCRWRRRRRTRRCIRCRSSSSRRASISASMGARASGSLLSSPPTRLTASATRSILYCSVQTSAPLDLLNGTYTVLFCSVQYSAVYVLYCTRTNVVYSTVRRTVQNQYCTLCDVMCVICSFIDHIFTSHVLLQQSQDASPGRRRQRSRRQSQNLHSQVLRFAPLLYSTSPPILCNTEYRTGQYSTLRIDSLLQYSTYSTVQYNEWLTYITLCAASRFDRAHVSSVSYFMSM